MLSSFEVGDQIRVQIVSTFEKAAEKVQRTSSLVQEICETPVREEDNLSLEKTPEGNCKAPTITIGGSGSPSRGSDIFPETTPAREEEIMTLEIIPEGTSTVPTISIEGSGSPFRGIDIPLENSSDGTAVEPREHLSPTAHNSSLNTLELENSPGKMLADSEAEKILKYIGVLNSQEEEKPPDTETSTPSRWADLIEEGEIEEPFHIDDNSRSDSREGQGLFTNSGVKPQWQLQHLTPPSTRSRGIGNDKSQNRLAKLINKWEPDILGIAEPKINPQDMPMSFLQSYGMSTTFHYNSGRSQIPNLWLFWKSSINPPNLLHCSQQHLTVEVEGSIITIIHAIVSRNEGGDKRAELQRHRYY
ncbi:hypothetical protein IFM89_038028 [Coptis chinensis]|uniref:Uncharacterized protein n=1 Tax=Coptis chinensis TaxID=261450 RepID=A0A835HMZ7_9MAGN|nr:hypothetical protein IFM89_038028 [Coptis chinensis]